MTNEFILEIIEKFNSSNIVDLNLSQGDSHISLKKKEGCVCKDEYISTPTAAEPVQTKTTENTEKSQPQKAQETSGFETLKSPIVGTFYRSPSPDSPAYAEKGKKIKKGEPICIIEAMKMMNTLNADYDFEVVDVLVQNGDLIEYDQPLFSIKKL